VAVVRPWPRRASRLVADHRIFRLRNDVRVSPVTGREHEVVVLEMPPWVNVIPMTSDGEVVVIRQFRHGIGAETLEIPGGMVDPEDASPAAAAARELREETGFVARELVELGALAPNPAVQDNRIHSFLARDVRRHGEPTLDGAEDIAVELVPMNAIPGLIARGEIVHSLVVAAFYLLAQHPLARG
jgi:8-oxo-dGTP pyrophosphatase MutT (NUDIX family)